MKNSGKISKNALLIHYDTASYKLSAENFFFCIKKHTFAAFFLHGILWENLTHIRLT
jgi:hypothetical protein